MFGRKIALNKDKICSASSLCSQQLIYHTKIVLQFLALGIVLTIGTVEISLAEKVWIDISKPYTEQFEVTNREEIIVTLPSEILENRRTLRLITTARFKYSGYSGYVQMGGSWFNKLYGFGSGRRAIDIAIDELQAGKNTLIFKLGNAPASSVMPTYRITNLEFVH